MEKKIKTAAEPKWEDIEKRAVDTFGNNENGAEFAISTWQEYVEKTRNTEDVGEIINTFTSPEVLDAVVGFFRADIEDNLAIHRAHVAKNARLAALMNIRSALGVHEGVFIDEEEGSVA